MENKELQGGLLDLLRIDLRDHSVIAVVGGGGKTSLIHCLREELVTAGKKVMITTTTHMAYESDSPFVRVLREKTTFVRFSLFDVTLPDVPVLLRSRQGEWSIRTDGAGRGSHLFPAGQSVRLHFRWIPLLLWNPARSGRLSYGNG